LFVGESARYSLPRNTNKGGASFHFAFGISAARVGVLK